MIAQALLFRGEMQFRREITVLEAIGFEPAVIVGSQRLVNRKPDQTSAILMSPARRRTLPELLADDPHEPGTKSRRLCCVQHRPGHSGKPARQQ